VVLSWGYKFGCLPVVVRVVRCFACLGLGSGVACLVGELNVTCLWLSVVGIGGVRVSGVERLALRTFSNLGSISCFKQF